MRIDLPDTTVSSIQKRLIRVREEGGAVALGRVLTLIVATALGHEEDAIAAANEASREHPMRVIIVSRNEGDHGSPGRLDAQIRIGSDAGASEVILLRAYGQTASDEESLVTGLLLSDAPVVTWWPETAPERPAESALGRLAQRRITDAAAQRDPAQAIRALGDSYVPGDTDFAWTRLTHWRNQLAAALDQPPYEPVTAVQVFGASDSPSTLLLSAWLQLQLQVPAETVVSPRATGSSGIHGVRLFRDSGVIELERPVVDVATLTMPGQPTHQLSLPRRNLRDCLAEELRRLDPDVLFGEVVTHGVRQLRDSVPS